MRSGVRAADHLQLPQLEEKIVSLLPEGIGTYSLVASRGRILEFGELADDKLVKIDDCLTHPRQGHIIGIPTIAAAAQDPVAVDPVDAELRLAALWTSLERRHNHVAWIEANSAHATILVGGRRVA